MKRIRWNADEAVALFDLYFKCGGNGTAPDLELERLSQAYRKRAEILELSPDDKFRNKAGLSMQLACIHYVVTDGAFGLSSASKLFYATYQLYKENPTIYDDILKQFHDAYM